MQPFPSRDLSHRSFGTRLRRNLRLFRMDFVIYCMLLPTLLFFLIFRVWPILNMRLAFFDFKARGPWVYVGLKYFRQIFMTPLFGNILRNTLIISFMKYVLMFPLFVLFAIALSEMRLHRARQFVQVVSYLPHFLSWVVIAGVWVNFLSPTRGAVNEIIGWFGGQPRSFMTGKGTIRWVLFFSEAWRSLGWDSILYFTTIIGISPSLYESADLDGANRPQIIRYIVLPMLLGPMSTMFILNLGYFLSAGFDQVINFTNPAVNSAIDILDTYIYRIGLQNGQYSLATAVGLFKGIVGMALVFATHVASRKITGEGVW